MPNYKGKKPGTRRVVLWHAGKRREWVVRGSKADGDRFEAKKRLEQRVEQGPSERRVAVTFYELSTEYRVHAEQHLKKSTWTSRKYQLANLIEHFGETPLPALTVGMVDAYKLARVRAKTMPSTVNNELRVLRAVLNWGKDMGHEVPLLKWKRLPVRGDPRARAFTLDELERLWAATRKKAPHILPMLIFLVNTGCRKGEAIAAEWSWVDEDLSMLRIPSNEHWQPKNGKPREVPISDALRAVLSGPPLHKRWLFPSRLKRQFNRFPKEMWGRIVETAGLSGGPHQLRHTFASHFLQAVPDLKLLAELLGHSHTRMTEIYAHLLPGRLDRARNAVNLAPQTVAVTVGRLKKKIAE
jgi:integrase